MKYIITTAALYLVFFGALLSADEKNQDTGEKNASEKSGWVAWRSLQSEGGPTLHIKGSFVVSDLGHDAMLKARKPKKDGEPSTDFDVIVIAHKSDRVFPQVITTREIQYTKTPFKHDIKTVTIHGVSDKPLVLKVTVAE